jgi:uncharacterized surface anchored protein
MPDSREGARVPPWRRMALALALGPAAIALLTAAAPGDATPTPSPSTSPSQPPQGRLTVVKTDQTGAVLVIAGAKFRVHKGTPTSPDVVATITTNNTGTAVTPDLDIGPMYCLEEVAAPPGFQVSPTYSTPNGCAPVPSTVRVADPPVASTPTPTASPTPTPTPMLTGELQISKVDSSNRPVTTPGFTFNVRVGAANGQVIATIATDGSGTAIAGALNPATYCVEEVSAPDGFQVQPTYTPSNCVAVKADPSQGRSPTIVTVSDPPAATPTPSPEAAGAPAASPTPGTANGAAEQPAQPALPMAAISRGLVGFGVLLLLAGAIMIVVAIRRRRMRPVEPPPTDYWYDSTIS